MNFDKQMFELIKILLSGFMGAFFAFIFIRISERIKSKKDQQKANIRALAKIQFICNNNYNSLNNIQFSINEILRVFKEARNQKKDPYSANRLDRIILDHEVLLDLSNVDFVNDYFSFTRTIEKHNDDVDNFNHFHESMKMARLSGQITSENYLENITRFEKNLEVFTKFVTDLMNQTEDIIAKCRVLLKDESSFIKKLFRITSKGYKKNFHKKYEAELILLKDEMKQIKEKSKKEIDDVHKDK